MRQIININAEDGNSYDSLRLTEQKLNQNFEECYSNITTLLGRAGTCAPMAERWAVPRSFLLQDEVTGSTTIDGSGNITLKATVRATSTAGAGEIVRRDASGGTAVARLSAHRVETERTGLAERFRSDIPLAPGTVVVLGGDAEITTTDLYGDPTVLGVVGDTPGQTLNSARGSDTTHPRVVLLGRTRCRVIGPVRRGDLLVASSTRGYAQSESAPAPGAVIGKALGDFTGTDGVIEIVVIAQ